MKWPVSRYTKPIHTMRKKPLICSLNSQLISACVAIALTLGAGASPAALAAPGRKSRADRGAPAAVPVVTEAGCILPAVRSALEAVKEARPKHVSYAEEVAELRDKLTDLRLDRIFREKKAVRIASGQVETRLAVTPEEQAQFKKAWDRFLLLHGRHVNGDIYKKLGPLAKAPDINADTLGGKYRGATLSQVANSIIFERMNDPKNRALVWRIFNRNPREIMAALTSIGVFVTIDFANTWWTNFKFGSVNNFGPAGLNAWIKVQVQDRYDAAMSGAANRQKNQIQARLDAITNNVRAEYAQPIVQPQARQDWLRFQSQYADQYKLLNKLQSEKPTISPAGATGATPAVSDSALRAKAQAGLDTAYQQLINARNALNASVNAHLVTAAAPGSASALTQIAGTAAAAVTDPDVLKSDLDTATRTYAKALGNSTFVQLSLTPPDKNLADEAAGSTDLSAQLAAQTPDNETLLAQVSSLAQMKYNNDTSRSPFKDFVDAFVDALPKPEHAAGTSAGSGRDQAEMNAAMSTARAANQTEALAERPTDPSAIPAHAAVHAPGAARH